MIAANSRYSSSVVTVGKNLMGANVRVIVPSQQEPYIIQYSTYVLNGGETVDYLAYKFYADPLLWWTIADANPEIMMWDSLPAGLVIRVPNAT